MNIPSRLERYTFYSFILLMIWLPLPLGSNRPWAWSLMELYITLQTISLLWVYRHGLAWQQLKAGWLLLIGLVFFQCWTLLQLIEFPVQIVSLLSPKSAELQLTFFSALGLVSDGLILSLDPEQTKISLIKGLSYCLLAFNTLILIYSPQRLRLLLLALVISGTFQAFYGAVLILCEVNLSPIFSVEIGKVATGSYIYKNHFANYLLMILCLGLGLIVADLKISRSESWRVSIVRIIKAIMSPKMLVSLCLVIIVIALVMSRSRMGNSAFFITTVIGGLAIFWYKDRPRVLSVLVFSVLLIHSLIVSSLFGLDKVRERLESIMLAEEGRIFIFVRALNMLWDFPFFGTGAGSFYAVFQHYLTKPIAGFYDHTHNDYLQFAIEYGLIATSLLGLVVLYVMWQCIKTIRVRNSSLMKGTAFGCFMAIFGMLIHISVDFNLQAPANAATFIVILCVGLISAKMPRDGYKKVLDYHEPPLT